MVSNLNSNFKKKYKKADYEWSIYALCQMKKNNEAKKTSRNSSLCQMKEKQ